MTANAAIADSKQRIVQRPVVAAIRRLIVTMGIALLLNSIFMRAGKGGALGGIDSSGRWIDETGALTDTAPQTITVNLQPSIVPVIAAVVLCMWALHRVMHSSKSDIELEQFLSRVASIFILVLIIGLMYAQTLFWITPLEGWGESGGTWIFPFPFGTLDVITEPVY